MNAFNQLEDSNLVQALRIGTQMKQSDSMGKEYYAFYNINADTILYWVETKLKELITGKGTHLVSVVGVTHRLLNKNCFKASHADESLIYVHKKRFKRFLKKAVQQSIQRG